MEELYRKGYEHLQAGDLTAASAQAEEGHRRAQDEGLSSWDSAFKILEAEILVSKRRNAEALALLDTALLAPGYSTPARVRGLMTRGLAQCRSGQATQGFLSAQASLDEAERLATSIQSAELIGEIALRRGTCYVHQKQWPEAESPFREALITGRAQRLPSLEANAAGSLGLIRTLTGRYDEATLWFRLSLKRATSIKADTPRAKSMINLGFCHYKLGDYDRAMSLLMEGERLASARGLVGDRLTALTNIGNIHYKLAEYPRAVEYYNRALVIADELGSRRDAAILLGNLGEVARVMGKYDDAESYLNRALSIQEKGEVDTERQRLRLTLGGVWALRGQLDKAETSNRELIASPSTEQGLRWQAWAALGDVHVRADRPVEADAAFRRALVLMDETRAMLREADHRITFFSSLRSFHDAYVGFLAGRDRPDDALTIAEQSRARLLRERLGDAGLRAMPSAKDYRQIARAIDTVLLTYWTGPERSYLWIVTAHGVKQLVLADEETLRRDVEAYQATILRSFDPLAQEVPEGERLWHRLVAPVADRIRPGMRVVVVPDGPLHQLNFEALVVPGPKPHYWIEDVTLVSAPSLSLLESQGRGGPASHRSLLVIGDPVSPSAEFPRLTHAKDEVAKIAALFEPSGRTVLTAAEAEPTAYKRADPGRFDVIHFAAHATANRESPLDSAVVLSARDDAYKLYARDIVNVPLRAELVTLSACHSAGSRAYAGEGLVGLAWAFLSTGAANVIGGLWNVEDASTSELMEHLYRGLREGLDPAAALRAAKLRLLHSGTVYRKPFYWAPFVVYTRRPTGGMHRQRIAGPNPTRGARSVSREGPGKTAH